jgi:DnaJ like chaperone protein
LSQHHPDKLVSKGLPEEMIRLATQKTHEIRQAYEMVRASRSSVATS